jgi:acyl-CoA synthetase (AMP-forming)/AMP-acid ligase II
MTLRPHQRRNAPLDIPYRSVTALLAAMTDRHGDKTFLICPGKSEDVFSYNEFHSRQLAVADRLRQQGLTKGHRVSLLSANSPEFLLFYFGALTLGLTVVPINPELSPPEIEYIVRDSASQHLFYHAALDSKALQVGTALSAQSIAFVELQSLIEAGSAPPATRPDGFTPVEPTDEAVIIYTSGTSGNPKGVVLCHLNLLADAKAISECFQFSPETRTLCVLPLFHNNGQVTTLLAPLYAGGSTAIVKGKPNLMSFWSLVETYQVTWTSVMASILSFLSSIPAERQDQTLRGILCGGQVLTRTVQDRFEERFGVSVFEGYGLTETTSFSCINGFPENHRRTGSIGRALPINDMAILDDAGQEVAPGGEGEICIRGPNVANEYLGLAEKNRQAFANGWFHSGDYGWMDGDGYFYFGSRRDFLIIKGGENIYGSELENVLYQHAAVAECAVIGIPDDLWGEEICAFVQRKEGTSVTPAELKEFCRAKIAAYKQAKVIIMINDLPDLPEIPKGPTKKVLYRQLQQYYAQMIDRRNSGERA